MPAPVVVEFQVGGIAQVQAAFRTVEQSLSRIERAAVTSAKREVDGREREYQRLARETERWQRQMVRDAEKGEKERVRLSEKSEKEKTDALKRENDKREREFARLAKDAARWEKEQLREFEKAEKDKTRIAERELDRRARLQRQFASALGGAVAGGIRTGVGRAATATMGVAGTVMQLGGGFSIADSVQRSTRASGLAADIANSGINPASGFAENAQRKSTGEIMSTARGAATQYGFGTDEALKGLQSFVGISGDLKTAQQTLGPLAQLSRATGASLDDMAAAAGNVAAVLPDTADKGERVMTIMRGIAGQGKMGAVEIRDLATQMAKLVAASGKFEGDNVGNILKLGAIAQAARGGGGAWSAASATTAVNSFTATFGKGARRDHFAQLGINLEGEGGKVRDPVAIITDSIVKTGGNIKQMNDLFGSVMGDRAVAKFVEVYRNKTSGVTNASDRERLGREAIQGQFDAYLNKAPMTPEAVAEAARIRMQEQDAKIAQTMARFDAAVADRLIPKLTELMPTIEKLVTQFVDLSAIAIPEFVKFIKSVGDFAEENKDIIRGIAAHPLGAIIAFEVTKSIAVAGIGQAVKIVLLQLLGGGGGGGGAGAGAAGAGSPLLGAAAIVAGSAVLGTSAALTTIESGENGRAKGRGQTRDMFAEVVQLKDDIASGRISKQDAAARANALGAQMKYAQDRYSDDQSVTGQLAGGADALFSPFSEGARHRQEESGKAAIVSASAEALAKSLDDLRKKVDAMPSGVASPDHPDRHTGAVN